MWSLVFKRQWKATEPTVLQPCRGAPLSAAVQTQSAEVPRRVRIFNVNDGVGARDLVSELLSRAGFEVVEAQSGAEALPVR